MPIYEFKCLRCGNAFEKILIGSEEEADLRCPECKSETLERIISRTSYKMARGAGDPKPKLTEKTCSSGKCFTLDLPGPSR